MHGRRHGIAVCVAILLHLAVLAFVSSAGAAPEPPTAGDWTIMVGEDVTISNRDLALAGGLYIYGHLTLQNCTLRPAGSGVLVYGGHLTLDSCTVVDSGIWTAGAAMLESTNTTISGGGMFEIGGSSRSWFVGGSMTGLTLSLSESSENHLTGCDLSEVGVYAQDNTTNTLTNCTVGAATLRSPSVTLVEGGAITIQVTLTVIGDTVLDLHGLRGGHQDATVITDQNPDSSGYRVELRDVNVPWIGLTAFWHSSVSATDCRFDGVTCGDYAHLSFAGGWVGALYVDTYYDTRYVPFCPTAGAVNVHVAGLHADGVTPQTTTITSDNTPFEIALSATVVGGAGFGLGNNDTNVGSQSVFEGVTVGSIVVWGTSSVAVNGGDVGWGGVQNAARLAMEGCRLDQLVLKGESSRATLRDSTIRGGARIGFFGYPWAPGAPVLELDRCDVGGEQGVYWEVGYPGTQPVSGRISGSADFSPSCWVLGWAADSSIVRSFPVHVTRSDGTTAANVPVSVTGPTDPADPSGGVSVFWSGATDASGYAYPEVTFDDLNYAAAYTVTATTSGSSISAPLGFLVSTPIELVVPIVYQVRWLPPLHDGTSENAADGPFKRGRTIPVKFELLDGEGRRVPDAEAQAMVAQLRVFYEVPIAGGEAIDPGEYPPDEGAEFRYQGGQFHYNLSTKDPAWLADYTYGLEVLIDGSVVGEVFFSLK
jgi:hypothetical protein